MGVVGTISLLSSIATSGVGVMAFLFWYCPFTWRPGLKVERFRCPSHLLSPLWIPIVIAVWVAWASAPEIKTGTDTTKDHKGVVTGLFVRCLIFVFLHPMMASVKFGLGVTLCKWPALVLCEIAKGIAVVALVLGIISMVDSGETTAGSAFVLAQCVMIACLLAYTIGRVFALVKVASSAEGLTSNGFNSYFFGTDPKCPITPYLLAYERKRLEKPTATAETQKLETIGKVTEVTEATADNTEF